MRNGNDFNRAGNNSTFFGGKIMWRPMKPNVCGYCNARLYDDEVNCPRCGKEFFVAEESYRKQHARLALWFGIWGIFGTVFIIGWFLSLVGLSHAYKAKSKGLMILNAIPTVAMVIFLVWLFVFD